MTSKHVLEHRSDSYGIHRLFLDGSFRLLFGRALLVIAASEQEIPERVINDALDSDLWWGRRIWLALRMLFNPSSQLVTL